MSASNNPVKKSISLYVLELGQFFIGGAICVNALLALFLEEGNNPFVYWAIVLLGLSFIVSAILLAANAYISRYSALVCFTALIFFTLFLIKKPSYWVALSIVMAIAMYLMYIHPANRQYYDELKSSK